MAVISRNQNTLNQAKGKLAGEVAWKSPSNIAIVKYWGKKPIQIPKNPSFSFTLSEAHTQTKLAYKPKEGVNQKIEFKFDGEAKPAFLPKIQQFLTKLDHLMPFLKELDLAIESSNSFPHSAGIASSASSMSALALCIVEMEQQIFSNSVNSYDFLKRTSYAARLGSGSAARSVYPYGAIWGTTRDVKDTSNEYAIPWETELHDSFKSFHDDILIISKAEKKVSSTAGHQLMDTNIFASTRFHQAEQNLEVLIKSLKEGDLHKFGEITEAEALSLHALMMTSTPPFILMESGTISAIKSLYKFRQETKLPIYFTLDAGPNLHLLYPHSIKEQVDSFITTDLRKYCSDGQIIRDFVGAGPSKLKS